MSIKRPNPTKDFVDEPPNNSGTEGPTLAEPSLEDIVERLKRVRPEVILGAKSSAPNLAGQQCIGRYKIQRIVGRGAFGVVYQAEDQQLGRKVALKVPRPEVLFDEEKLRRFESEAATAAALEHPSIIPIYEADLTGPTPYIASAYCAGPNLSEWQENQKTPIPVEQAARFVIKLAEAVHFAHQQGVLHRDLKPSNIMLEPCQPDSNGGNQLEKFEPKLTDFGLAKLLESDLQETRSSIMLGTPRYMAPEQFDKRLGVIGVQSDIYALGAILYELLIGQPAAEGSSHMELMLSIVERQVTSPSRIRSSVTPTLEAICLKALEKRPQNRYATSLELAEDLGRYLRGEPTRAKPLGFPSRVAKWIKLNPLAASLLAMVSISIVGLVLGVSWHNVRLREQLAVSDRLRIESADNARQSDRLRKESVKNARHSLRARYVSDIQLAQQAIAGGRFSEAQSRLKNYQPGTNGAEVSDFAWHLLNDYLSKTHAKLDFDGPLRALAISDALNASVTGGEDGMLRFFDTTTGVQLAQTQSHEGNINAIAFAADGTTLVSGGDDGMLCVWDISSLRDGGVINLSRSCKAHEDDLLCLAVSPNSKWIASGSADNTVRLWKYEELEPTGDLLGHTDWVRGLDFSPDSTSLVSGSHDTTIRRWDIETKQEVNRYFADHLVEQKECVYCLKHHPIEPLIIAGYKDETIRIWDISTSEQRQEMDVFNGWVRSLSISADGTRIAASADEARIMLFEKGTEGRYEQSKVVFTNRTKNMGIAFTNSDTQVVSAGIAGASVWSTDHNLGGEAICVIKHFPLCITCLPDENTVALVNNGGIYTTDLESSDAYQHSSVSARKAAISRDGSLVALILYDTRIQLSDRSMKSPRILFSERGDDIYFGVDISPSGEFVAAATRDNMIRIWQGPDFTQETVIKNPYDRDFNHLFIQDSGTQLFLQPGMSHEMIVLDVATGKPVTALKNIEEILNRSADGQLLAISLSDYSVTIYDTQQHQIIQTLPSHGNEVIAACFSPVEPLMATFTSENEMVLWALDTGESLIRIQTNFKTKSEADILLTFTSDGRTLAAAGIADDEPSNNTELRVWRAP